MDGWTELTPASLPDDKETLVRVMWQKRDGDIRLDEPVPLRVVLEMVWYAAQLDDTWTGTKIVPVYGQDGFEVKRAERIAHGYDDEWKSAVRVWMEDNDLRLK